ncbi:hypothetical protein HOH87_05220 [bacterium]|jgi:CDP-diacylglycerol--glycerol-3-phosphate 3-phosphatidyltransferase/CDP-diacylglycerol--serine O-phosphatidyltransferase|nr:hypothetical protein [bacterium]
MIPVRHIANLITMTRILGVGIIFWLTPYETSYGLLVVLSIYILIAFTDYLDGWVARKLSIESDLGKVLDPLADKILVLVFLPLLEMQIITSFPVFIILAREFAIMALRVFSAKEAGVVIPAQFSGKLKTALTLPVCGILLARVPVQEAVQSPWLLMPLDWARLWVISWPQSVISLLVYLTVAVTVWSFFEYFDDFIWALYLKKWNGDEDAARRSLRSLIPNAFSFFNLICGASAVGYAAYGHYHTAALLVILGVMFDAVDGSLARRLDAFSSFGASLDSLADFVSFGVAPAVVIYRLISTSSIPFATYAAIGMGLVYYISVHYRLRRFSDSGGHVSYFDGLPSPVGAALVIVAAISPSLSTIYVFLGVVMGSCLLMISRLQYEHLDIAKKERFFRFFRIPGLIFTGLTILKLLEIPFTQKVYAFEILFVLTCIYVISPLFLRPQADDTPH